MSLPAKVAPHPATLKRPDRTLGPLCWFADVEAVTTQDFLVRDLILAGSLTVIYGESNSGKTFLTLDLMMAIALGQPWNGHRVRRGLVLYVAAEGGSGIQNRLAAYRQENPPPAGAPFALLRQSVDLLRAEADTAGLIELIREAESESGEKAAAVVIDTLARALAGGDENSAEDMSALIANADRIRLETGAAVVLIHHSGKDTAKGARGHSSLRGAVDTEILVEGQDNPRTATVTKQRDLASGQRFGFELVSITVGLDAEDGAPVTSCVVRYVEVQGPAHKPQGKQQLAILRLLEAESRSGAPIWTTTEIKRMARERLGIAKTSAQSAVLSLTNAGFLKATVGGLTLADPEDDGR